VILFVTKAMKKFGFSFLLLLNHFCFNAQNVVIRGYADKVHNGKIIRAYTYDDLITYTRIQQAADTIDSKGFFELPFSVDYPSKIMLSVGNLTGNLYALPYYYYAVTFPAPDSLYDLNPNAEYPVDLGFIFKEKNDTTEMNSLIINFNRDYRQFFIENAQAIVAKKGFYHKLDSFQLASIKKYEKVGEPFFKTWLEYSFAEINEELLRNRSVIANAYIVNKPVLHEHAEYMQFINAFFNQYLLLKSGAKRGTSIPDIINESGSLTALRQVMSTDPYLKNDTLCELIIIKGLYEMYFSPEFKRENVKQMIEEAGRVTSIEAHKKIINNIIKQIYRLSPGSSAPEFSLKNKKGELISLKDFRGKFIYLDFMASWCVPCLKELKEISELKKKYGDKVVFISISVDENENDFKKFIEKNSKYDWQFLWYGTDKSVKEKYNIKALPTCFFIDEEGLLILSPAPNAGSGFEGKLQNYVKPPKKKRN
jgi:thiol-disulfide isomerase/thioredoxin